MARIRRALQHGLLIGGRTFLPVASSASQQKYVRDGGAMLIDRDHAMWFIDSKAIDGLELRRWMGDVAETVVAKHAARMGLVSSYPQ
jgi:RNA-dependent RNA polymerase